MNYTFFIIVTHYEPKAKPKDLKIHPVNPKFSQDLPRAS